MIAIIDYGLGNAGSVANMLEELDIENEITCAIPKLQRADRLILPGVGSFDRGMQQLGMLGLVPVIKKAAEDGKPILGICLGMQLLGRKSEEGSLRGMGLIPFDNIRFQAEKTAGLKIPHMGWDTIGLRKNDPLTYGLSQDNDRFYFVHSYHAVCDREENILMTCDYGYEFAAAVFKDNIYGVQFHPEKSHYFGMKLLQNFAKRC